MSSAPKNQKPMRTGVALFLIAIFSAASPSTGEVRLTWDETGHVTVPTRVNGQGPFAFLLDTGADESAVYETFAQRLSLPRVGHTQLSGATGSEETSLVDVARIFVDQVQLSHLHVDVLPDRPDGATLAGVVGADLMKDHLLIADFGCNIASLTRLPHVRGSIFHSQAFVQAGSIPDGQTLTLPVEINGVRGTALLDSGARATIINTAFARAAHIDTTAPGFQDGPPTRGVTAQTFASRIGPIGEVRFAGIVRSNAIARVADLPAFQGAGFADQPAMILGLNLLQGTRLTLDYSARHLRLAESTCRR